MTAPLIVTLKAEKSGLPTIAAISGVRMLVTKDETTAPKAAPMTTATARSITLPRIMNCRNPLNISPPVCYPSPREKLRGLATPWRMMIPQSVAPVRQRVLVTLIYNRTFTPTRLDHTVSFEDSVYQLRQQK